MVSTHRVAGTYSGEGKEGTRPLLGDDYMTIQALAEELGICTRTLERWQTSRYGPPRITLGKRILYKRESVRAWLDGKEEQPLRHPDAEQRIKKRYRSRTLKGSA